MTKKEFDDTLKKLNLSRHEFADITNLTYGAVSNWNDDKKPVPGWVESWLYYYMKAKENETLNTIINPIIARELRKRELSSMLDSLLKLDINKLIDIFEDVISVYRKITLMASSGEKITKKYLANELEGMTMSIYTNFNKTFLKIHSITNVMLNNSDTEILFEFGR